MKAPLRPFLTVYARADAHVTEPGLWESIVCRQHVYVRMALLVGSPTKVPILVVKLRQELWGPFRSHTSLCQQTVKELDKEKQESYCDHGDGSWHFFYAGMHVGL